MADHYPLRIVYVSGVPTIGEFQSGDTVPVDSGGTGVSSLGQLADLLNAIPGGALSSLTDDVALNAPGNPLDYGDVLTWNGSNWINNHVPHLEFGDYSGAPYNISSISFLTNLGSITLQEGEIAWDGTASTIQVQTDASTTQLAVLQVSSASNDGDILLWDGTKGYYYPTSAFVDVSSQVDVNTSALENTLDASDLSVELSAISTELSAISIELSSIVSSIHLSGLGDVSFTDLSADQHLNWDGTNWVNADNDRTEMRVRNGTASPMSKGDVIAIQNAHNQNLVNVVLADASQTSAMPALGILKDDLAVGAEGIAITFGKAQGLNTSGLTEGATAYVSPTTPGTITETKPTDTSHLIQNIGIIMRAHPSNGAIKVTGIGRANDIDNQTRADIDSKVDKTDLIQLQKSPWVEGSGSQLPDWTALGNANNENIREVQLNPHEDYDVVWKTQDYDSNNPIGGFETTVEIDDTETYRVSFFVKSDLSGGDLRVYNYSYQADGSSTNNFITNTITSATYFEHRAFALLDPPQNEKWYLVVYHINDKYKSTRLSEYNTDHLDTGVYDAESGMLIEELIERRFRDAYLETSGSHKYIKISVGRPQTAGTGSVYLWGMRVDKVGPDMPSISDLLGKPVKNINDTYTTNMYQQWGAYPWIVSSLPVEIPSPDGDFDNQVGYTWYPWRSGNPTEFINGIDAYGTSSVLAKINYVSGVQVGIQNDFRKNSISRYNTYRISHFVKIVSEYDNIPDSFWIHYHSDAELLNVGGGYLDIPREIPEANKWYLAVSYINAYGSEITSHDDTGYWDVETRVKTGSVAEIQMGPKVATFSEGIWFNSTDGSAGDYMLISDMRCDIMNDHTPSVQELLEKGQFAHSRMTGLDANDHPQYVLSSTNSALSSLVTSIETSTVDISSYIAANEGTWSTGGGGVVTDHGALTGLADNDHPQYVLSATNNALSSLVTNIETSTVDISSYIANNLFSGNIEVTGTNPLHIGTIGTTDAATFGVQSDVNTGIVAPSIILSATTAYQFRKNGSTTYTDTDFPQSCRDWDSAYNTVLNSSGSWGGGGGGGTSVQTPIVSGSLYHFREGFINSINNRDVETGTFWVAGGNGVTVDVTDYNDDTRSSVAAYVNSAGDRWTYWPIPNFFRTANAADGDEMLLEARVKLTDSTGTGGGISLGFVDWDGNNAIAFNTAPPADETYAEDHANIHFDIAHTNVQIAHLDSGGGSTPTVTDLGASYPMSSYVDVWYRVAVHIKYNSVSTNWDVQFYINGSAVGSSISHSLTGSIVPFVGAYYGTGAANTFIFNVDWFDVQFKIGDDASEAYLDMTTL